VTDVCLILEGTYPFVSGGVSTWIHQLITAMSELRFSIVYISAQPDPRREYKYRLPANVVDLQDLHLSGTPTEGELATHRERRHGFQRLSAVHEDVFAGRYEAFSTILPLLRGPKALAPADFFHSEEAFEVLTKFYGDYAGDASFLDYFWSLRSIYGPLLATLRAPLPPARLYHTVSTGYAGLLACVAKNTQDAGVLLTEHGVYTHERLLEISQATWIYTPHHERFRVQRELSYFKKLWLGFFDTMGRLTYHHADRIVTLYEGNKLKQIAAGAPHEKISIIPNGIDVPFYRSIQPQHRRARAKTVGFIGRIVPIKDVKTLLHAAKLVLAERSDTEFLIIGPTDEEPEYTQECKDLARALNLGERVKFLGKAEMKEWYPKLDVVVLTSLSEAQPYVLLEANAVGVPVVATDVGACREMLEGRGEADRKLGASGLLTGVANPEETARAVLRLLSEPDLWVSMSEAGRARTLRFYDQNDLISKYLNLYETMMR
jgi:glycosyltransferase involved in cell wall biosynthesis